MLALVELEHRLAGLEMVADEQARLLELRQHAVDRGEADVEALAEQQLVDVLGRQVPDLRRLEEVDDLEARQRGLEAGALEILGRGHGGVGGGGKGYNSADDCGPAGPRRPCRGVPPHGGRAGDDPVTAHASAPTPIRPCCSRAHAAPRRAPSRCVAGCAQMTPALRQLHPDDHAVRRVQARHQPGQLHLAGHGRPAEGRADQAAGARWRSARRSSRARSATTAGTTSTSSRAPGRVREHRQFTVYFKDDNARALGRRRDAAVDRRS